MVRNYYFINAIYHTSHPITGMIVRILENANKKKEKKC